MKTIAALTLFILILPAGAAWSHCQVPCGIYDDDMRLEMIGEHIKTIERSMQQIQHLSKSEDTSANQIIRWVNNKDEHADALVDIVTWYFMTQRVKPVKPATQEDYQGYVQKITLLHEMMFYSMKAKQSTDLEYISTLKKLHEDFSKAYTGR